MQEHKNTSSSDEGSLAPREAETLTSRGRVKALAFATTRRAPLYRAIVEVFFEAKQRYVIELRAADVRLALQGKGAVLAFDEPSEEASLDRALGQLVRWGNLTRSHDTSAVSRIDDFYRRRHVFHLTAAGEAAHRAVVEVEASIGKAGSLQTTMLVKIRDTLEQLVRLSRSADAEGERLLGLVYDLFSSFDTLTAEATRFIGELGRHLQPEGPVEASFELHKQAVLAYVGRFVSRLRGLAAQITCGLEALRGRVVDAVMTRAAGAADLPPGGEGSEAFRRRQLDRFDGLCAWFIGTSSCGATVDRLAQVAVGAVVELTRTLGRLNERRSRAVDRAADFRALARWFAECDSEAEAHRLWRGAFGLTSARHFHLEEDDSELTGPEASWWEASPAVVPLSLRQVGHLSQAGRPPAIADHSEGKQWIGQLRRRERERERAALARFDGGEPRRLSSLVTLEQPELEVLMTLLDDALGSRRDAEGRRRSTTADGRLDVTLLDPADSSDQAMVALATPLGTLHCRDFQIVVRRREQQGRGLPRSALPRDEAA